MYRGCVALLFALILLDRGGDNRPSSVVSGSQAVDGSGIVVEESRNASGRVHVTHAGVGTLYVEQETSESLRIRAEDNLLPHPITELAGDELTILVEPEFGPQPIRTIEFFLTVRDLDRASLSGAWIVELHDISVDRLFVGVSGVDDVALEHLDDQRLEVGLDGVGSIRASGSIVDQDVALSGGGDCEAAANRGLIAASLGARPARS
jgi:hypothetical protein